MHGHDHGHEHGHDHGHDHGHGHGKLPKRPASAADERRKDRNRLLFALILTGTIALAEAVGGYLTNSLALMSDAGHMLTDVSALALSLLALWFAGKPANLKKTYGYYRMEILSALLNGVLLLGITTVILYEAWQRFRSPTPVQLGPMAVVALVGLVANLGALGFLHNTHSMNVRGAFLHVLGDTLSSVGVLIGAGIMAMTGLVRRGSDHLGGHLRGDRGGCAAAGARRGGRAARGGAGPRGPGGREGADAEGARGERRA